MKNAVTRTLDLQRETIRRITDIVMADGNQPGSKGDADKVASVIAEICEYEMLYDQIMEARS